MRRTVLGSIFVLALFGCGREDPRALDEAGLSKPLTRVMEALDARGYDVQAVAVGPEDKAAVLVEGSDRVVVMSTVRGGYSMGWRQRLALNEVFDDSGDSSSPDRTVIVCRRVVVVGESDRHTRRVERAIQECREADRRG